ncbi:MAG: LytTR family DNA-binding domain-containing protein [Undibacterium sp.]|nr:LytTR family DNA-binding domain-containing protein [Undibacterium sp.]
MKPLKILIVDDEAPACERMRCLIEDIQAACPCVLVGMAFDGQTALDGLMEHGPDVVLLDVQMPGMTGLELAQHIARLALPRAPAIVFVTAYDEFALQAFEVHAMDYLLKPVRAVRLQACLERIRAQREQFSPSTENSLAEVLNTLPKKRQHFSIVEKNRVLLIPVNEVIFLKAEQKYVTIQTKSRTYLTEESLVSIENELGQVFIRAHRNALVARDMIIGVERALHAVDADGEKASETWQVIVKDSAERLPISRRQWAVIKELVR